MTAMEHGTRSRTTRLVALVAAAAAALVGGAAGPASAAPKEPLSYVALGDSYASGFGAELNPEDYDPCGQSPSGLPGILDGKKQIALVANETCAGAGIAQVGLQAAAAPLGTADLITISVGGNDAGFAEIAGVCATRPAAECAQFITQSVSALPPLGDALGALYASIEKTAPEATVIVTGYPHLFSPEFGTPIIPLESQIAFNAGIDALNAVIRAQAEARGFVFVDVVPKFEGHGLGSPDPWITLGGYPPDDLHPTAEGYKSGYFPAVRSAVNLAQLQR